MEEPICDVCNVITTVEANGKKLIVFYNKKESLFLIFFYNFAFKLKKHPKERFKSHQSCTC